MKNEYNRQELITIVSALLATGHYTHLSDHEFDEDKIPEFKTLRNGKDWREDAGCWGWYENRAIVDAIQILDEIPRALKASAWKSHSETKTQANPT